MAKAYSGDKIVITKKEAGSLFPTNREEVSKDIIIDGTEEKFRVQGGVFSNNISMRGSGSIEGAIFAKNSLTVKPGDEPIILRSGVTALDSFLVQETTKSDIEQKLSYSFNNLKVLVKGDILSEKKVVLNDTVVLGSIIASDIVLNNSIVLGAIKNAKQIQVKNSNLGIYITNYISFEGSIGFFITGGKSKEQPEFIEKEDQQPIMRFLPLCRLNGYGCGMIDSETEEESENVGICCSKWATQSCPLYENISIEKNDFAQMDIENDESWYLGLQGRSLTMNKITEINNNYKRIIHGLFAYEHLTNKAQESEVNLWNKLSLSEKKMFKMATQ